MGRAPLRTATKVGADETINIAEQPEGLAKFAADKGQFDVLFEASGNERALRAFRRLGFVEEGRRRAAVRVGQEWYDTVEFGLLREEWETTAAHHAPPA